VKAPIKAGTHVPAWGFYRGLRSAGMALAALVWLAMLIWGGAGSLLDERLYGDLYAGTNRIFARNASFLTLLGSWKVLVPLAIVAAIFLAFTRRMRAALLLIMVFGGRLLVELQKVLVDRPRPGVSPHLEAVHSMSFPSGHSANAMITYVAIAALLPVAQRMRAVAVGIALAIAIQVGWSRVALGVHWPSDVIGGWAFGLLWVALCMRMASARPEAEPS
jgi:membrane-associated phospholipid phosphatase